MNITIICDVLGKANNGTTLAALNLIDYLRKSGHNVTVLSPDKSTEGKEGYIVVPKLNLGKFLNKVLENNGVELAKADKSLINKAIENADVVHLLVPLPLSWGAIKIIREKKIPVTASFHCQAENVTAHLGLMNNAFANRLIYKFFYKKIYRYCDMIHYPTEFIKQMFLNTVKKDLPGTVISNGVNELFFEPCKGEKYEKFTILCTGRYSREKSQSVLIKAVNKSKYKDSIKLIFAGSGPKKKKLMRLAKRKGIDAEFNFYSREELNKILHSVNLYVHTAVIEIEAIACLEAIVSGLVPIICDSKRSATRYFAIDDNNLFKVNSKKDLCKKIEYFYSNPEEIERYKQKYSLEKEKYNQKACMQKMENMLVEVAEKGKS